MRKPGSNGERTWSTIRQAGIKLLYEHGYEGMNLRLLAREADLQVGSLYNYITNKEEFVAGIVCDTMNELVRSIVQVFNDDDGAVKKAKKYTAVMVDWQTARKEEVIICQSETRILPKQYLDDFLRLRKQFEDISLTIVKEGVAEGVFHVSDPKIASIGIFNMLMGISVWYREDGRLSVESLKSEYTSLVLNMLGMVLPMKKYSIAEVSAPIEH